MVATADAPAPEVVPAEEQKVSLREIAALSGFSERSLYRHRDKLPAPLPQAGPPYRRGARVLWSKAVILEWLRKREAVLS